ncbi:SAV_2336 N-terminal domain-related protein [Streptomyces griseosporeus]|uniref:SAV_2336 N-terminal domain-related protein n=1 Tax=Streptomyces griseosporeus TaxID=1910 RepID=UPI00379214B2
MFGELKRILEAAGLDSADEELLDALWLTTWLPQGPDAPLARHLRNAQGGEETVPAPERPPSVPETPPVADRDVGSPALRDVAEGRRATRSTRDQALASLAGSPPPAAAPRQALLPGAKVLGDDLVLGRALRPLKRRVPSTQRTELDEAATAASQAETRIPNVVLRALPERWLRLALVIDGEASMVLWERHWRELRTVLERSGAFRQTEVHQLCYGPPREGKPTGDVWLVRPGRGGRTPSLPTSALHDPSGRTLIVLVTDGAAASWQDDRMRAELERWAQTGPTAVLHVLPRHLWAGTGINAATWLISSPRPGAPNAAWHVTDPVLPHHLAAFGRTPVPVVELTPSGLAAWATGITTVDRPVRMRLWEPAAPAERPALDPHSGARAFARTASPPAVRLAAHLAAAAPLTVPVMQLVQSCLPGHSRTSALAEVFLSGLLQPVARPGQPIPDGPMKHRLFDFTASAKDLLLDTVPLAELVASSRRVGERIEQLVGRSPDFPAWLVPSRTARRPDSLPQPFARISTSLLTRLGLDDEDEERERPTTPVRTALVCTALPLEYAAVRRHILRSRELVDKSGTRVEMGPLPGTDWHVALAELGEGSVTAAALTTRLITWIKPDVMLFVGIAGALKADIGLGDVVVGTKVYGVRSGKQTPDGFQIRPEMWHASHALVGAARSAAREMPDVRVHLKPIVSLDVVPAEAESAIARYLREYYNDAAAIGTESAEAVLAAHLNGQLHALVVRGISDHADAATYEADAQSRQERAAAHAASVAVAVLRKHGPYKGSSYTAQGTVHSAHQLSITPTTGQAPSPPDRQMSTPTSLGPVPAATSTLPARTPGFTGRFAELDRLLALLAPTSGDGIPILLSAITGMGGIGKTALAVEAAHRAREQDWFPGGFLFVDLRGYDENPVTADQAVLSLLDAFGVRRDDLPLTPAEQYDTYRALLAQRQARMLMILDNASDPSQYVPLLPGTDHHRILITSRDRPDALPTRVIDLDVLTPEDAIGLIIRGLHLTDERDDRAEREPQALRELAALCGHLPLALQIATAMLRRRRHRDIASLVHEIRQAGDPATVLNSAGVDTYGRPLALRPVLETSYRRLPPQQARLLRLLCIAPSPETRTEAVAALAGLEVDSTITLLEDLAATGLVTPTAGDDDTLAALRWRLSGLVRAYGAGLVAADAELRAEAEDAKERVLTYYQRWAHAADERLRWLPGRQEPERFADRGQALAWLDAERTGLITATSWAREPRFTDTGVRLAGSLATYLSWRRYFDDWIAVARVAQEAAHRAGDLHGEATACGDRGLALREGGRVQEAIDANTHALDLFRALGDRHSEATTWNILGLALQDAGRVQEAIDASTRALDLFRALSDRHSEATTWNNLGLALHHAGRLQEAIDANTHALDLFRALGDRHSEATTWNNLGLSLEPAGRGQEAVAAYEKALLIYHEFEDWYRTGRTLVNLASIHEHARRSAEARSSYLLAADAFARAGAPAEEAHARTQAERND